MQIWEPPAPRCLICANSLTAPGIAVQDADLGTAGPTVLDLPGSTPSELVFIGGKEGIVYLLDR